MLVAGNAIRFVFLTVIFELKQENIEEGAMIFQLQINGCVICKRFRFMVDVANLDF